MSPLRVVPRRDRKLNREVKAAEPLRLRAGETLWTRGDAAHTLVLVRDGHLRLTEPRRSGDSGATMRVLGPWEMGGEEALVVDGRRPYGAVAGEASTVQWLDRRRVLSVLATSRVTRNAFLAAWVNDLHALSHRAAGGTGRLDAAGRLAAVLLDLARRWSSSDRPCVPVGITHATLADLAGLHRSTVTSQLNEWAYQGWITDLDRGYRLDEPDELEECAALTPVLHSR